MIGRHTFATSNHGSGGIQKFDARSTHCFSRYANYMFYFQFMLTERLKGDAPILAAAQQQIRHEFRQKSSLNSSDASTQEAIQHAQEVANFLKANVVQGKRMEGGENMYRRLRNM